MFFRCVLVVPSDRNFSLLHDCALYVFAVLVKYFSEYLQPGCRLLDKQTLPITFVGLVPVTIFCSQPNIWNHLECLLHRCSLSIANHTDYIASILRQLRKVLDRLVFGLHVVLAVLLAGKCFVVDQDETARRFQEFLVKVS